MCLSLIGCRRISDTSENLQGKTEMTSESKGNGTAIEMPRVGGYSAVGVDDLDVVAAANFAISEESKSGESLRLIAISSAQAQVVAGRNFRVVLSIDKSGVTKMAEAVVYLDLAQNLSLTSWTWK